jgi:LmbE family N-acetylglucosaminyl deacetylase
MAMLADRGVELILVVATAGEGGAPHAGDGERRGLADVRRAETLAAAARLGVSDVRFLGYEDSGLDGTAAEGFAAAPVEEAGGRLAGLLHELGTHSLVIYDGGGIYDHPDHVQVHLVGHAAAEQLPVDTIYECTVDREYLHFVETHLVVQAAIPHRPETLGLAATSLGSATVEIDVAVDVASVLDRKRAAMAAHGSQIPESSPTLQLPGASFSAVYGLEWYCRVGSPGPLDRLTT